jgi:polar amino acid transport system substrate-binding protein
MHALTPIQRNLVIKLPTPKNIEVSKAFLPAFKNLYAAAGLCAEFTAMPYNRADTALRQGTVDANALRTKDYIENHAQNVIYVDAPIITISSYLFGGEKITNILPRSDMQPRQDMPIGYMASNKWAESMAMRISSKAIPVRTLPQLIAMLETGRIDGFIIDDLNYNLLSKKNEINLGAYKRKFVGAYPLYHALNIKHQNVKQALEQAAAQANLENDFMQAYQKWIGETDSYYLKFSTTASKERFPFTIGIDGDQDRTLLFEAISMILNETPYTPKRFDIAATSRLDALKAGAIDFITFSPSWLPKGQALPNTIFSDPLYPISDSVVCQGEYVDKVKTLEQLHRGEVGTVLGYRYFDEDQLQRRDYPSESALLNALHNKKVDCAILGTLNFRAYNKKHSTTLAESFIHSTGAYHLLIREELKDILNDINNAIKSKRESGELDALMQDYIAKIEGAR